MIYILLSICTLAAGDNIIDNTINNKDKIVTYQISPSPVCNSYIIIVKSLFDLLVILWRKGDTICCTVKAEGRGHQKGIWDYCEAGWSKASMENKWNWSGRFRKICMITGIWDLSLILNNKFVIPEDCWSAPRNV